MSAPQLTTGWHDANQRYCMAAFAEVRAAIQVLAYSQQVSGDGAMAAVPTAEAPAPMPDSALETLCRLLDLSSFERKILLMCAGVEWDARFANLCAQAQEDPRRTYPTFSLALAAFDDNHWSALSPDRPLRYWRLLKINGAEPLTVSPIRIDERILHYLSGVTCLDEELRALETI